MSRKAKAFRAWSFQNPTCRSTEDAFKAGWDAQKGIAHAKTVQNLEAENADLKLRLKRWQQQGNQIGTKYQVKELKAENERLEAALKAIECFGHGLGQRRGYRCATMAQQAIDAAREGEE